MNINTFSFFCSKYFVLSLLVFLSYSSDCQTLLNQSSINSEKLNEFILKEVNELREKANVTDLKIGSELKNASDDHANYMLKKKKLTHYQRKKVKKTPKNRVDFYGRLFDRVGENVQLNNLNLQSTADNKKNPPISTYEKLAEQLVLAWKNSPPHYANMIEPTFINTCTSVAIGDNGEIYACQVFGGEKYQDIYNGQRDTVDFKPDRPWRCWRCRIRPPQGRIDVTSDSMIVYSFDSPTFLFGLVPIPPILRTRMRFFNPWTDGLAADIIVKSQYPCDSNSNFNGQSYFRGIPLEPVYKKDYMGIGLYHTEIVLGKVPSYIQEEFEVNLVVIQNRRPCSNTMFNFIPSGFHVEIPLSYGFEPSANILKNVELDSLMKRIHFDKSMITSNDTSLTEIIEQLNHKKDKIVNIEILGFASIEGTSENNTSLYRSRANFLLKTLDSLGIDTSIIRVNTEENFIDFRKDIKGTKYEELGALTNAELKQKLSNKAFSAELEFILKHHRYVNLKLISRTEFELKYDKEIVNMQLEKAINKSDISKSEEMQRIQYGLLKAGEISFKEIEEVEIPFEKKFLKLLHNRTVMKFSTDTITIETLKSFRAELWQLRNLKEEDERLNTSCAIIDYYLYSLGSYEVENKKPTFYDSIRKWKQLDNVQQARILLNYCSNRDWGYWRSTGSTNESDYLFRKAKSYIKPARLDVDKTFEIASYYSFFWQYKYAYNLIRGKIDETENPDDLIYFLKLVHLTDLKLSRNIYLNCFKKIRKYSGSEFCSYFNNPALNFQILDDPEIKEIYCEECGAK